MDWDKSTTDICLYSPFLARALMSLPMVETTQIETMATDGKRILWNRTFAEGLTPEERDGVRVHEVLHVLLGHHVRRGNREPKKWNYACDYEINPYVVGSGYTLPKDALLNSKYNNMTAEEIYELLPDQPEMPTWGGFTMDPNATDEEKAQAADEWRKMMAGTNWGTVPATLRRALDEQLKPKKDLAAAVAQWLQNAFPSDNETWAPPSRRNSMLPSEDIGTGGHVVICVDTSGSIGKEELQRFMQSILGLADIGQLDCIAGDSDVTGEWLDIDHDGVSQVAAEIGGGGGTDFRPLIARAASQFPDAIIYVTDGYGDFGHSPPQPVLWAMTTDVVAPYGHTMRLEM